MNIFMIAVRLYQRSRLVGLAVRCGVALHHKIFKPATRPCPFAAGDRCSSHFAEQAKGARWSGLAVLPSILAAMAACGPGAQSSSAGTGCQWEHAGVDKAEWCIKAATGTPSGGGWC